jgi:DNA-binding IclR family transcriptional regulator
VLQELVNRFGETVHLAVLERHKALYLDKVQGTHVVTVTGARVGTQIDPHCTAVSKILLATANPPRSAASSRKPPCAPCPPRRSLTWTRSRRSSAAPEPTAMPTTDEALSDVHCVAAAFGTRMESSWRR